MKLYNEVEYDNNYLINMKEKGRKGLSLIEIIQYCKVSPFRELCFRKNGLKLKLGKIHNGIADIEIYLPWREYHG